MANLTDEEFKATQITLSFTPEEIEMCFGESPDENSDEEEFDAKAWRQDIRDLHRDLEMKKYAYHKRLLLEDMRERKRQREEAYSQAMERKRQEELAIERKAQKEFNAKQRQLQFFKDCDERIRISLRKKREEKRKREAEHLLIDDDVPPKKKVVLNATDLTD